MGPTELTLLLALGLPIVIGGAIVVFVLSNVRRRAGSGAIGSGFGMAPPPDEQGDVARLRATGHRARAHLTALRPTGIVLNQVNVGVEMSFLLEPLDGSPRFEGSKRGVVSQAQMPRIGDVWPAWYDAADRSTFMVALATQATPETIELFREFGIPHPLDHLMGGSGATTPPPPAGGVPATPPPMPQPAAPDPVGDLERLVQLHESGHLTASEFAEAKRRLLEG